MGVEFKEKNTAGKAVENAIQMEGQGTGAALLFRPFKEASLGHRKLEVSE